MDNLTDSEVEKALLGGFLLGAPGEVVAKVRDLCPVESFTGPYRHLYAAMCALQDTGVELDIFTVRAELESRGVLGVVGGVEAVAQLADTIPTSANMLHHAKIVRDLWLRRGLVGVGEKAKSKAFAKDIPVDQSYSDTVTDLIGGIAPTLTQGVKPLREGLYSALESLLARQDGALDPGATSTGLNDLDGLLGGLAPGRLVVVAAGPKKGKTSLALQMARKAAESGPVYFASLEMGVGELTERLVLAEAGVTQRKRQRFSDSEIPHLTRAANTLAALPLAIDTTARFPSSIRLAVQAQIALGQRPSLVVIDYLQLLRWPGKNENKNIEIGSITRFLKLDVAMSLNVPVLLLSQLSRNRVENGKERPPILTDLRDSGSIEQDADQIVMLHYAGADDGRSHLEPWGSPTRTEVYVRGNRHGPGGKVDVYYNRPTGEWRDLSRYDEP